MKFSYIVFIMLFILIKNNTIVQCLKCYQCRSDKNASCEPKPDIKYLLECKPKVATTISNELISQIVKEGTSTTPKKVRRQATTGATSSVESVTTSSIGLKTASTIGVNTTSSVANGKTITTPGAQYGVAHCRRVTQILYFKDPTEYHTIRECTFLDSVTGCKRHSWKDIYLMVCTCHEDGCNRASLSIGTNWTTLLPFLVLARWFPP